MQTVVKGVAQLPMKAVKPLLLVDIPLQQYLNSAFSLFAWRRKVSRKLRGASEWKVDDPEAMKYSRNWQRHKFGSETKGTTPKSYSLSR